jgi:hypothetical protein
MSQFIAVVYRTIGTVQSLTRQCCVMPVKSLPLRSSVTKSHDSSSNLSSMPVTTIQLATHRQNLLRNRQNGTRKLVLGRQSARNSRRLSITTNDSRDQHGTPYSNWCDCDTRVRVLLGLSHKCACWAVGSFSRA